MREPIGAGGMGVVYIAEQMQPIRRKVALKLIKPGMDSQAVIARFEQERQALALMDHPNIAKVLDAGTMPGAGRSYFVMGLVLTNMTKIYLAAKQPEQMVLLLRNLLARQEKRYGSDHPKLAIVQTSVGWNLLNRGLPAEAEPILRECPATRGQVEPDSWRTFNARALQGRGRALAQAVAQDKRHREVTCCPVRHPFHPEN